MLATRLRGIQFQSRDHRLALAGLGVLLLAGIVLRLLFMFAWRPAFLGYPDSSVYLEAAYGEFDDPSIPDSVFFDRLRPAGFPIFLRLMHAITPHLSFAIFVQHALGVATAVLLYLAVRRIGGPAWLGLVPAAFVLLNGTEIFLEHAALTEAVYIFLQAGALYAVVRALDSPDPGWAALSGFLIGAATDVRFLGLVLVPPLVLWLFIARRDTLLGRAVHGGALLAASAVLIGGYVYAQRQDTGFTGITQSGMWNLYARVAQFADCSEFTPPEGTEVLCESTPPSERPGQSVYMFASSPATRAFGFPDYGGPRLSSSEDNAKVAAFARAVFLHQPLDYFRHVSREMVRYVVPSRFKGDPGDGFGNPQLIRTLQDPDYGNFIMDRAVRPYYETQNYAVDDGLLSALETYERRTRIEGPLIVLLVLLTIAGPFAARGRLRWGSILFSVFALELLIGPVAAIGYDARYAVAIFGVLGASAALGGWALWERWAEGSPRPVRVRTRREAPAPNRPPPRRPGSA